MVWATSIEQGTNAPVSVAETVPPDAPVIYAVVPVSSLQAGSRVSAVWTYNGTPIEGFRSEVVGDGRGGHAWLEFHLGLNGLPSWPVGTYAVTVSLNDTAAQTASINVGG